MAASNVKEANLPTPKLNANAKTVRMDRIVSQMPPYVPSVKLGKWEQVSHCRLSPMFAYSAMLGTMLQQGHRNV